MQQPRPALLRTVTLLGLATLIFLISGSASAQNYSYSIPEMSINVYWNEDGTSSIDYVIVFQNDLGASPIEYVDIGLPTDNYDRNNISGDVDGIPITNIEDSPVVDIGTALGLGANSIPAGQSGQVHAFIGTVYDVLYPDSEDENYASAVFKNTAFDASQLSGPTDMTVTFHLPPGIQPGEPRWHASDAGWPPEPIAGFDDQGRITYLWQNPTADTSQQYTFGASFPINYIPEETIVRGSSFAWVGALFAWIGQAIFPLSCFAIFFIFIFLGARASQNRKLSYLPPKIAIEGHGIKRGLTAVEAAILMEQPMDKIMTMILFGLIKKNAAQVASRDPLKLEKIEPVPPDLNQYEKDFLDAFGRLSPQEQRKGLQATLVSLVKSAGEKMKGFSRRETIAYYKDIMQRAWAQVEAAGTPEVKSAKFDEVIEWTMLDKDYDRHTREVFREGPIFVPLWWPRFDPGFGRPSPTAAKPLGAPLPSAGPGSSLPHLPGADFAASMVTGMQTFASKAVGNITEFTNSVTKVTNPPPPPSTTSRSSSGGGGGGSHSCACACACAGCACACAGGGR